MKKDQGLMCDFNQFPEFILKVFSKCKSYPANFEATMYINFDQRGYIEISTSNELKKFILLVIDFNAVSEVIMRNVIVYKYSVLKAKTELFENRLIEVIQNVKKTNPNLALILHGDKVF